MAGVAGKRSGLYTYISEAVRRTRPKVFVAENVGGLLLKQNEYSLKKILTDFNALGYDVSYHLYHAEQYGVPQTRERVIFVGTRKDMPHFIVPSPSTVRPVTAKEALEDLEALPEDKSMAHVWSKANASGEQGNRRLVADPQSLFSLTSLRNKEPGIPVPHFFSKYLLSDTNVGGKSPASPYICFRKWFRSGFINNLFY